TAFREAIRLKPDYVEAHNNLGLALMATGRLDEAIVELSAATRLQPREAKSQAALGEALLREGQFAEARRTTLYALELLTAGHPLRQHVSQQLVTWERLLTLEGRLPAILRGDARPLEAAEQFEFAMVCQLSKHHVAASRLYADAFAQQPKLADD